MNIELPNNWVEVNLDEVVSYQKGKKPKILKDAFFKDSVPYLDIMAFEKGIVRRYADVESSNLIEDKSIGIVWDGARSGWVSMGQNGAVGSTIAILKPFAIESVYLYRFLQSNFNFLNTNTRGTGIPHVDPRILWNIKFPLAPLKEQQRVVAKLDSLFSQLDDVKSSLEKIPELLKNFRQAILSQAVNGKLTEEWRKGGDFDWKKSKIGDFMYEVKDRGNPLEIPETAYLGLEHFLKDGGIVTSASSKDVKSIKTVFKKGDVLYGKLRPYLNKHDVVKFDGVCSTDILVYRNKDERKANFFNMFLGTSSFIQKSNKESKGINLPRVSSKIINDFEISIPENKELEEIFNKVKNLFDKASIIEKKYKLLKEKTDILPQSILHKAFKGKLVQQLTTDGDARELLMEIKKLKEEASLKFKKKSIKNAKRGKTKEQKINKLKAEIKNILIDNHKGLTFDELIEKFNKNEDSNLVSFVIEKLISNKSITQYFNSYKKEMRIKINP